jgi:hypothetical protein
MYLDEVFLERREFVLAPEDFEANCYFPWNKTILDFFG